MYWTEIKNALLYGQPSITYDTLQSQAVGIAVREIARLVNFGWIDELTEDVRQRIQTACQMSQCQEIWDEFQVEIPSRPKRRKTKNIRKKRQKKQALLERTA